MDAELCRILDNPPAKFFVNEAHRDYRKEQREERIQISSSFGHVDVSQTDQLIENPFHHKQRDIEDDEHQRDADQHTQPSRMTRNTVSHDMIIYV